MNKLLRLCVLFFLTAVTCFAQDNNLNFKPLTNGLEYAFIKGKLNKKAPAVGDRISVQYVFKLQDSVLNDHSTKDPLVLLLNNDYKDANAFMYQLPFEGLHKMKEGDSAVFRILVKDFFANQKIKTLPGWNDQDYLYWNIKVPQYESRKDYVKRMNSLRVINDSFNAVDNYLQYKIIKLGKGGTVGDIGDMLRIHVNYKIGDSVVFQSTTLDEGKALPQQITPPGIQGDLMKGFMLLQQGDSAVFRIKHADYTASSHYNKNPKIANDTYHIWEVKIEELKTKAEVEADKLAHQTKQNAIDFKLIDEYIAAKKWTVTKRLPNGLVYVETKAGSGAHPVDLSKVVVNYTGKFLSDVLFDSNVDPQFNHVTPFSFEIGKKQVIQGWDEGLKLMQKGSKGFLLIPSVMGYGSRAQGPIPENAVLVFEVELLDFN